MFRYVNATRKIFKIFLGVGLRFHSFICRKERTCKALVCSLQKYFRKISLFGKKKKKPQIAEKWISLQERIRNASTLNVRRCRFGAWTTPCWRIETHTTIWICPNMFLMRKKNSFSTRFSVFSINCVVLCRPLLKIILVPYYALRTEGYDKFIVWIGDIRNLSADKRTF